MSPTAPPTRRWLLAGGVLALLAVASVVIGLEILRHPEPATGTVVVDARDPRLGPACPDAPAREGVARSPRLSGGTPQTVTSIELLSCPDSWDGRRVRYRGEAVGTALARERGTWLQLNDDTYATLREPVAAARVYAGANIGVGVLVPHSVAREITVFGGPRTRGDILEVTGTFARVDQRTGEVAVVLADNGRVLSDGSPLADPLLPRRRVAGIAAVLIGLACVAAERWSARSRTMRRVGA